MQPPRNHLAKSKKPKENSSVTTVTTYNPPLDARSELEKKSGLEITKNAPEAYIGEVARGGYTHPVKRLVALNETGTQRIGEDHANAKLTDAQVEAIRDEYEAGVEGEGPRIGYRLLARKYGCSKRTVRDIVNYNRRNHWAARWKRLDKGKGST